MFLSRQVNQYEKERAALLADAGYVAFAADIYGAALQEDLDMATMVAQSTLYRTTNNTLFVSRMQRAVELVQSYDFVDADNVVIIGYCFGGTGAIQYAFTGRDDVKLVAAFHGNVQEQFLPKVNTTIVPYTMVLSGGADDAHGNQTILEESLNNNKADWEITRYSGVLHGFTQWGATNYNLNADVRSWTAMMTAMAELVEVPQMASENSTNDQTSDSPVASPVGTSAAVKAINVVALATVASATIVSMIL
jgi:dienelactone hydrolase